jgi:hypothetical protein
MNDVTRRASISLENMLVGSGGGNGKVTGGDGVVVKMQSCGCRACTLSTFVFNVGAVMEYVAPADADDRGVPLLHLGDSVARADAVKAQLPVASNSGML